jgi:uncharacterized protein YjbI with pentapeptide repeats
MERTKQHALLTQENTGRGSFGFDHEEFYHYFLGRGVAGTVRSGNDSDVRQLLSNAGLPPLSVEVASGILRMADANARRLMVQRLNETCRLEGPASFSRENSGALIAKLLAGLSDVTVCALAFPVDALDALSLQDVTFDRCHFQPTGIRGSSLAGCIFRDCVFERIDISQGADVLGARLAACRVHSVIDETRDANLFDPASIEAQITSAGFKLGSRQLVLKQQERDERLVLFERAIRAFQRDSNVSEITLRQRLRSRAAMFFDEVLPALLSSGVLEEVAYRRGTETQRGFRLRIRFIDLARALSGGHESLDGLLARVRARTQSDPSPAS